MDFSQIQLIYRAEGNANLVLVLPQHKKVLRLPKATLDRPKTDEKSVDLKDHVAYMGLLTHLLGEEYAYRPEIVTISSTERDRLNRFSMSYRPAQRLDKEFCGQFGLLLPDATQLPDDLQLKFATFKRTSGDTYSIEIKPKQGWMLQDTELPDLFDLNGSKRCRYCCMQYLKLKNRKISQLSSYCPMDLFSGNLERMKRALEGLLKAPQNNLRIFKNGILVYGADQHDNSLEAIFPNGNHTILCDIILHCLLKEYKKHKLIETSFDGYCNQLPRFSALGKLFELQLLAKKNMKFMGNLKYNSDKTFHYLKKIVNKQFSTVPDLDPVEQYLVGATAMDCSILITFEEFENNGLSADDTVLRNIVELGNKSFITKVTVVDLDPKPDNHFLKYAMQTNEAYKVAAEGLR